MGASSSLAQRRALKMYGTAPATVAWKGYVVPSSQLREVILSKKDRLMADSVLAPRDGMDYFDDDLGWRVTLADRVAQINRARPEAAIRRIYSVMSGESAVCEANFADAVCLALGLFMDRDTTLQTFPGSIATAQEMVQFRRPDLKGVELRQMAEKLMVYRNRVLFPDGYTPSAASVAARKARHRRRQAAQQQAMAA